MNMTEVAQFVVTGVISGSFFALVATAMQVIYGSSRILNFAEGELVVLGMFAMWVMGAGLGWNPLLALALVVPIGLLAGALFYVVVVRPLDGRPILQTALATLAGGVVLRGVYALVFGSQVKVVPEAIRGAPIVVSGVFLNRQGLLILAGSLLSLGLLALLFRFTWIGLAMRATAESREGAEVTGVDPRWISLVAFALAGAVSALAGGLMAPILGARFDFGLDFVLVAFVAATLGGLTSTVGAAVGGFALGLSIALIAAAVGSEFQSLWILVILVPLLFLRPHGVLGRMVRE